ncbi:UNVERIFIED_CONTAM: hypothetical protein H355_005276 [Colinus virginianus]|nr:hypothetical protein H355_005276 [Colinus virginianus]
MRCRVWRAYDRRLEVMVALKQMRLLQHQSSREGFPRTTVREIGLLKQLQHPNIVELLEIVCGPEMSSTLKPKKPKAKDPKEQQPYTGDKSVYLVFEHCEGDLGVLLDARTQPFSASQIKSIMKQLLQGLHHLHANFIIHRDVKLSNILITSSGCVKLADFGLTRQTVCLQRYTTATVVGVLSLRLLLHVMALCCCALSSGAWRPQTNTLKEVFKKETANCLDLLNRFLTFNPAKRISARDVAFRLFRSSSFVYRRALHRKPTQNCLSC